MEVHVARKVADSAAPYFPGATRLEAEEGAVIYNDDSGEDRTTRADRDGQLEPLELENAQLREALTSRIVIEQAKGILAERFELDVGQAFDLLRTAARSNRMRIRDLAAAVTAERTTPVEIELVLRANGSFAAKRHAAD
jgi:hypothetical protein